MENEEFLRLCKAKVAEYTNSHMDKTDGKQITVQDVYVVSHRLRCPLLTLRISTYGRKK